MKLDQVTLDATFASNLNWIQLNYPPLFDFIKSSLDESLTRIDFVVNADDIAVYDQNQLIYSSIYKELDDKYQSILNYPQKISKIGCNPYDDVDDDEILTLSSYNREDLFRSIFGIKLDNISERLPIHSLSSIDSKLPQRAPIASNCVLGILGLLPIYRAVSQSPKDFSSQFFTFVESDPIFLIILLHLVDLVDVIDVFKVSSIGLTLISEIDVDVLKKSLIDVFICKNIFFMYVTSIISLGNIAPELMQISTWLQAEDGLRQYLYACLGNTSDEINHCVNTSWNLSSNRTYSLLSDLQIPSDCLVTIVASGPSVQSTVEYLKKDTSHQIVVACGSALGVIARAGIQPDFIVLLERSPDVFTDVQEILHKYPKIAESILLAVTSIDPRISSLFSQTIYFFRQASAVSKLFDKYNSSQLPMCGPNVINAAFEAFLQCGARNFLLAGCDFASPTNDSRSRASSATGGRYKRNLNIPVAGAEGRTVFSDSRLLVSRNMLEAILIQYNDVNVFRVGNGAIIEGVLQEKLDDVHKIFDNYKDLTLSYRLSRSIVNVSEVKECLNVPQKISNNWFESIKNIISGSELSVGQLREINTYISRYSYTTLNSADCFARDLVAQPLFAAMLKYYSSNRSYESLIASLDVLSLVIQESVVLMQCARSCSELDTVFSLEAFIDEISEA